jgi:hypothetical protein
MSYLIEVDAESVPERLTASASSLRQALADGDVDRIYVWFVHNCPGSENVRRELHAVEQTVHSIVANRFKNSTLSVIAEEISAATLEKLYTDTNTPILVNDVVEFKADSVLDFSSSDWSCYVLPLPATLLRDLYERHKTDLFSANVRDFLGMKAGDSNINYQMQKSLRERPQNFFVYNNGLTILTHRIEVNREAPPGISVAVHGMSIVNGAQTTGTIGTSQEAPATLM